MGESPPAEFKYLESLFTGLKQDMSERMDRFEENVDKRLDRFESQMAEYVLKAVFESELRHIRDDVEAQRIQAEADKKAASQRVTWWIAVGGVVITALSIVSQVLMN